MVIDLSEQNADRAEIQKWYNTQSSTNVYHKLIYLIGKEFRERNRNVLTKSTTSWE